MDHAEQKRICEHYAAAFDPSDDFEIAGVAKNINSGLLPVNGLRLPREKGTSGWYLWAGSELSQAADFFQPMHVTHLTDLCPLALKFLALPPGWRFLCDETYEDVWFDASLLDAG